MLLRENEIDAIIALFGTNEARQMIYEMLPSEQVISFRFDIDNNGSMNIIQIQRHHTDKLEISDLIKSFWAWKEVKDIYDSDNECDMYPNMIAVYDISNEHRISVSDDGSEILTNNKGVIRRSSVHDFYRHIYCAEKQFENDNRIVRYKRILDIDGYKEAFPNLHGKCFDFSIVEFEELLEFQDTLGIKIYPMTSLYSDDCHVETLVIWD